MKLLWNVKYYAKNAWCYERPYLPKGLGTMEPVERVAPNLYRFEATIMYSILAFLPSSASVAFTTVIKALTVAFAFTPA